MTTRTTTGGLKEFTSPGELGDTESSREFKKAYLFHHFLKNPSDIENREKLKEYMPFYKLNVSLDKERKPAKFSLEVIHDKRKFLKFEKVKGRKELELPKGKYTLRIITKQFFFFEKKKILHVDLSKNSKEDLHY